MAVLTGMFTVRLPTSPGTFIQPAYRHRWLITDRTSRLIEESLCS
ncbi:hypothetical protein HMPREF9056_02949 [Actinomyces sp. oral taxon 170 str. F0386]|nr:hypothetical protein HMPREF9056_02949 [Actinomyces sp. oral taxon 170 str. F0386]